LKAPIKRYSLLFLFLTLAIINLGCHVQLIAKYDQSATDDILRTYKEIDNFYINLLNTPKEERLYKSYSNTLNTIESEISLMVLKNSARALNTESTKIAKNILDSWRKHKNLFKKDNSYSDEDISFDRETFFDNFVILLNTEQAKPMTD
jgi:hypothetical protein